MTRAKAQTVASVLIGQGYSIVVTKIEDDEYVIRADGTEILARTVSDFATNQAVSATVTNAKFS